MQQEDSRTDLTSLYNQNGSPPTEEAILNFLASRYKKNLPYTQLGYSNLIVINPYQQLELLNDATLQSYAEIGYKDLSQQKPILQPHVYGLATKVYFHMRRTGEDQSIILSGITGSGKSATRTHLIAELLNLSAHNKRENKLSTQIQNASTIIEAFGHARTTQNPSASKFGMFQEIQLNERGRILGAKTLTYQFDPSRVTHVPTNERSYHIFYSLFAGTTLDEKTALHINFRPDYFNYLNKSGLISVPNWNDEFKFGELKSALKVCGFKAKTVTQIFQLLSAILHIGNLQFMENTDALAQEACAVKNTDVLDIVAVMLGVSPSKLETCLTYKLKMIGKEVCTIFLNPQAAADQRDDLACALYKLLFMWIVESINKKVCYTGPTEPANVIGILDQFGFQNFQTNSFQEFCINLANERIQHFILNESFNLEQGMSPIMLEDGVPLPSIKYLDNSSCLELLVGKDKKQLIEDVHQKKEAQVKSSALGLAGLAGLLNRDSAKHQSGATDATNANFLANLQRQSGTHPALSRNSQTYAFGINHFSGTVHYSVDMFLEKNLDDLSPDFVNMLRDSSSNGFVSSLFEASAMATESHPKDVRTIVKAQLTSKPARAPSMRRKTTKRRANETPELQKQIKLAEEAYENMEQMTVVDQLYITLRDIIFSMSDTKLYQVIHLRPNDNQLPEFDHVRVRSQVRAYLLPEWSGRLEYANYYTYQEFDARYAAFLGSEPIREWVGKMGWSSPGEIYLGQTYVWLSYEVWKVLEDFIRAAEKESKAQPAEVEDPQAIHPPVGGYMDHGYHQQDMGGYYMDSPDHPYGDNESLAYTEDKREIEGSQWGEESEWGINGLAEGFGPNMDMSKMIEDVQVSKIENVEEVPITNIRRWWVRFVWFMTWWIPSPFLKWFGKMSRPDIQMAWREKVALCMIIFFFSGVILFFIVGLGVVMCPGTAHMYSPGNVNAHNLENDNYMSVRGVVYDVTAFSRLNHGSSLFKADVNTMAAYAGMDVSSSIPPPLTVACVNLVSNPTVKIIPNTTVNAQTTFVHYSGDQLQYTEIADLRNGNWYWDTFLPSMETYKKGPLVHLLRDLKSDADSWGRYALAINNKVYDLTDYFSTIDIFGTTISDYNFFPDTITDFFKKYRGTDATAKWDQYKAALSAEDQAKNMNCLNNYFYVGNVDPREEARCTFANYLLLACAILMCVVILVKFLAALQFGTAPTPEDHDKFVICQVPCYTEDENSLKKTIDSLTVMKYDDKRKLLFLIADGMVMGSGNDRPTPRIVLDILGYDTKNDPEPLMFKSVGEGAKQLNYGKIYSGLYECEGHVVPYIVVAKVGKASERAKPGNRGKRDSQMIVMNFLNRVHFDSEMTPMELELYHQIKNVIGVNPSFYEYILMVDSDTEVMPHSLNYLISAMLHDGRIMGICGETAIANEKESWTTMIQVYEYYISHYLAKAFESLFGSVTCLPGCFCMYRVRTPVKNEPLIISPKVVHDYSENLVDTLHKKNLLSLGEDRYLTTLMMKHFPNYKMKFTPYASCRTVAPEKWQVLLSQRRRWINSTIHNLLEVVLLPDLCGFCLFSMRFVVLVDLIGTLTLPVSFCYLIYLIYVMIAHAGPFPTLAIGMLGGLYAIQIILFVLKREWQHIGWMFFYIFALPVYSFLLPVYSFWHFDDFSWGNTRVVVGDTQRMIIATDEEKFDEKMIPMKKWSVYEQELWEMGSQGSRETGMTGNTYNSYVAPGYDNRSYYSSSSVNGGGAAGDYDFYRDTKVSEKQQRQMRPQSGFHSAAGSVVGSEYGRNTPMIPMMDYNRNATPPPGMMRPMSYASNTDFMNPPMVDPRGSFGVFDGRASPGLLNQKNRNGSYDRLSNYSGTHLMNNQMGNDPHGFDIPMGSVSQVSVPPMIPSGFPSDDEILTEIKSILATANLMSITKKQVREQLSRIFGCDMNLKKEFINSSIEYVLQGQL